MLKKYLVIILALLTLLIPTSLAIDIENNIDNTTQNNNFNIEIILPNTYNKVMPGTEIWFTTHIINLGNSQRLDIVLKSEIIDAQEKVLVSTTKTVAMETQASFVSNIEVPKELTPGKYAIRVKIDSTDAQATHEFIISNKDNSKYYIIIGIILVILIIIMIITFSRKKISSFLMEYKIKHIISKRLKKIKKN